MTEHRRALSSSVDALSVVSSFGFGFERARASSFGRRSTIRHARDAGVDERDADDDGRRAAAETDDVGAEEQIRGGGSFGRRSVRRSEKTSGDARRSFDDDARECDDGFKG